MRQSCGIPEIIKWKPEELPMTTFMVSNYPFTHFYRLLIVYNSGKEDLFPTWVGPLSWYFDVPPIEISHWLSMSYFLEITLNHFEAQRNFVVINTELKPSEFYLNLWVSTSWGYQTSMTLSVFDCGFTGKLHLWSSRCRVTRVQVILWPQKPTKNSTLGLWGFGLCKQVADLARPVWLPSLQ